MQTGAEHAAQTLERIRSEPLALRDFLKRMPKGADLHSHLSGAVYAETHIRDAIADGLCVDQDAKAFAKSQPVIAGAEIEPVCEQDQVPATELPKNQPLYNSLAFLLDARLRAVGRRHWTRPFLSFLPGVSLWAGSDFARLADACGGDAGADKPSSACDTFLKASEKAEQQWELEKRFQVFEAGF